MPCGAEKSEVDGVFNGPVEDESTEGHDSLILTAREQCTMKRGEKCSWSIGSVKRSGGPSLWGRQDVTRLRCDLVSCWADARLAPRRAWLRMLSHGLRSRKVSLLTSFISGQVVTSQHQSVSMTTQWQRSAHLLLYRLSSLLTRLQTSSLFRLS